MDRVKVFLKISLDGVPADDTKPARFKLQLGGAVIDIMAPDAQANVRVVVDGIVGGNKVGASFQTRLEGGQRLILPELSDPGRLKVEKIDNILGNGRDFKILNRQ